MIEDLLNFLKSEQNFSTHIKQLNYQIERLERENKARLARYERLKSKIDRLNKVKALLAYIEDPLIDEFSSGYSGYPNDLLEKTIKANF